MRRAISGNGARGVRGRIARIIGVEAIADAGWATAAAGIFGGHHAIVGALTVVGIRLASSAARPIRVGVTVADRAGGRRRSRSASATAGGIAGAWHGRAGVTAGAWFAARDESARTVEA